MQTSFLGGIEQNPKHFATAVERISAAWDQQQ